MLHCGNSSDIAVPNQSDALAITTTLAFGSETLGYFVQMTIAENFANG